MVSSKLPNTGTTIFSVMSKMAAEHDAVNLSQGFPDFDVSGQLIELISQAMLDGHNQYAPMTGLGSLREIIAHKLTEANGRPIHPEKEITITAGATEALFATIMALVQNGDEVLLLDPCYDSYSPAITLAGGIPKYVALKQPDFSIDWEAVREKVNQNTRIFLVNSPHNPSGSIISEADLKEMKRLLTDFPRLILLGDEVYEHIVFDQQKHLSVLSIPGVTNRCIATYSFGKTFHATGWKVGYVVAPEEITREIRKVHQYLTFSVNTPTQHALAEYLQNPHNYLQLPAFYQQKRDLFLEVIEGSSFKPISCSGTYFQLLDYSQLSDEKDTLLAERLVKEHKIAAIPVSVFYHDLQDHKLLRFCFAKKEDTLIQAGEILRKI